jgi:hypothetical protein
MARFTIEREYNGNYTINFMRKRRFFVIYTRTKNEYMYEQIQTHILQGIKTGMFDYLFQPQNVSEALLIKKKRDSGRRALHYIDMVCAVSHAQSIKLYGNNKKKKN